MAGFDELLAEAESRAMKGWDFGWLDGRMHSDGVPWDYPATVERFLARASRVLDMGTGGGEFLASVGSLPSRTVATEGWAPNVDVAAARLRPLGIPVVHDEGAIDNLDQPRGNPGGRLAFRDGCFDLVINRHEAYNAAEVRRVLQPGSPFLTQQAGSGGADAGSLLGVPLPKDAFDRPFAVAQLIAAGFEVLDGDSAIETITFADVGAFAWYLRVIPWMVPGFTIDAHRETLCSLHTSRTPLRIHIPRFWLFARSAAT